ncbi:hypothetical protein SAMN05216456_1349 [Devosia crocina]|uniref:Uncharacterized protein n=1 Tax=Devosia crocina TaxID=429728 RepID=A0A1I7N9V9_9HYPH|nr:hypothetical protein [Devosia crocina]SFV31464.1 hypothetical protein SAMN05216456_1349 [Devosia crocina]
MIELFAGIVQLQYGQAYVELDGAFDGNMENSFIGQSNGLCGAAASEILFLVTGLHTGPVGLTVNLFDAAPELDQEWEEVVEVSFRAPRGEITLMEWGADQGVRIAVPSGEYRARCYGVDMEEANALDTNITEVPVDRYRLDLWLAPSAPDRVIKQTSEVAAYWHDWAGTLASPER